MIFDRCSTHRCVSKIIVKRQQSLVCPLFAAFAAWRVFPPFFAGKQPREEAAEAVHFHEDDRCDEQCQQLRDDETTDHRDAERLAQL